MWRRLVTVLICTQVTSSPAGEPPTSQPAERIAVREVHDQREGAKVSVSVEGDTLHVDAISPKGIGGTRLVRVAGDWPAKVVVRLRYSEDRPFTHLEGPGASLENETFEARPEQVAVLKRIDGGFTFALPRTDAKVLYINWVDAFR